MGHAIGSALEFIHSKTMVCGDVKPANVMRFPGNRWKLIDLGGAVSAGDVCIEFTSSYCAPELAKAFLEGKEARASTCSDVWSFGKVRCHASKIRTNTLGGSACLTICCTSLQKYAKIPWQNFTFRFACVVHHMLHQKKAAYLCVFWKPERASSSQSLLRL